MQSPLRRPPWLALHWSHRARQYEFSRSICPEARQAAPDCGLSRPRDLLPQARASVNARPRPPEAPVMSHTFDINPLSAVRRKLAADETVNHAILFGCIAAHGVCNVIRSEE